MNVGKLTGKMVEFCHGNLHDVNHFLKVHALARTIGELEGLDDGTQAALEIAAIVHDIACPLCREKYDDTHGKHQEAEGPALAGAFLEEFALPGPLVDRVCFLVGRHHTYSDVDGMDYQILLEADFLVNADEASASPAVVESMRRKVFRTRSGIRLLESMYGL